MSIAFHTNEDIATYACSIRFFGATLNNNTKPWRAFYNASTGVFRLYWHYGDYTTTGINVLRREGFPAPSNGTWYETLPSDNGTELGISYNSADTATQLLTARTINGTSFNGTANITTAKWGTARSIYIRDASQAHTGAAVSVDGSANEYLLLPATITATLSGNASSASKLQTARTLWGQSFNGTANVSGDMTGVGALTASGEIKSSSVNAFRLSAGSYGTILRNSDNNFYILATNSGQAASGSFNSLRPFYINLTTGNVMMQHKLTVNGVIENGTGIFSNGYVSAKGQNTSSDMRLKKKIDDIYVPIEKIANAPSFSFRWKDGSGDSAGSSAQYWRDVIPSAVNERGGWLEMQYGNIALLSAISIARETLRLGRRMDSVEKRARRLEEENRRLRAELRKLYA